MIPNHRLETGRRGENAASKYLRRQGFTIVERNFRTRYGELDLVARKSDLIVFCEVKTRTGPYRTNYFHPFLSVGPRKQWRVRRMAETWLTRQGRSLTPISIDHRFDVIGVTLDLKGRVLDIEHLANAFESSN